MEIPVADGRQKERKNLRLARDNGPAMPLLRGCLSTSIPDVHSGREAIELERLMRGMKGNPG